MDFKLRMLRKITRSLSRVRGSYRVVGFVRRRYRDQGRSLLIDDFQGDLKIRVDLNDHLGSHIAWHGEYNRDMFRVFDRVLRPGDHVFDIGANIGETVLAAWKRVGPEGRIHAFEPMKSVLPRLRENLDLNGCDNVHVVPLALSDRAGTADIFARGAVDGDGLSFHETVCTLCPRDGQSPPVDRIELSTLDDYVRRHDVARLDALKIDVEGAELSVLRGGAETLRRFRPLIFLEVAEENCLSAGHQGADLLAFLEPLGYRFQCIGRKGRLRDIDRQGLNTFQNVLCRPTPSAAH